jgi:hypothetical protein
MMMSHLFKPTVDEKEINFHLPRLIGSWGINKLIKSRNEQNLESQNLQTRGISELARSLVEGTFFTCKERVSRIHNTQGG